MRTKTLKKLFVILALVFSLVPAQLSAQGHFEFGFHYSSWSLNVLKSLIEDGINDAVENS